MRTKLLATHILAGFLVLVLARVATGLGFLPLLILATLIGWLFGSIAWSLMGEPLNKIRTWIKMIPDDSAVFSKRDSDIADIAGALEAARDQFNNTLSELAADKQRAELILDNMRDGVLLIDSQNQVVLANPAAEKIFERSKKELISRPLIYTLHSKELDKLIHRVIEKGEEEEADINIFLPKERRLRAVALPVYDEKRLSAVLTVFQDITKRHRIDAVRRDFVANVSHELKTPVAGVNLLAESLQASVDIDNKAAKNFSTKLGREAKLLVQLVSDLLDLSQLESPEMKPMFAPLSLSALTKKIVVGFAEKAADKGISLRTEIPLGLGKINGNRDQLKLMIRNLIENAIHYTPTGGDVLIKTETEDPFIVLEIVDTGIGIPADDLGRVFERFYRVDKARSRETGGTGLGLSIAKHVIDNHGGKIELVSTIGLGSKFKVFLPVREDTKDKQSQQAADA